MQMKCAGRKSEDTEERREQKSRGETRKREKTKSGAF